MVDSIPGSGSFLNRNPDEPIHWSDEPVTDKQMSAIVNMYKALKWEYDSPKTKGEAAKLIDEAQKEINKRILCTGQISPDSAFDDIPSEWDDPDDIYSYYEGPDEIW